MSPRKFLSSRIFLFAFLCTIAHAATSLAAGENAIFVKTSLWQEMRERQEAKGLALEIEINGQRQNVYVFPEKVRSEKFRFQSSDSHGQIQTMSELPTRSKTSHFRGNFLFSGNEQETGHLALTFVENSNQKKLWGTVILLQSHRVYNFSLPTSDQASADQPTVISLQETEDFGGKTCSLAEEPHAEPTDQTRGSDFLGSEIFTALTSGPWIAEIAIEMDNEFITKNSGIENATHRVESILNVLNSIYEPQLGITFRISHLHWWENTADPYSGTDPSSRLAQFRSYWNANFTSVPRDLVHLWTGVNLDGSTIGIAGLSVVCRRESAYGLSQDFSANIGNLGMLMAHEVGHNFGAGHDSSCQPPYIMCSNLQNTTQFSTQSVNAITNYSTQQTCLGEPSQSTPTPTPTPTATPTPTPTYILTLTTTGTGTGTVSKTPHQNFYNSGTPVNLGATPAQNSTFSGWSGNSDCTDGQVTMNANKTCTATFTIKSFTITASNNTGGSINPSGSVSVNFGSSKTFQITPATGYHIAHVLVNGVSVGAVQTYTFSNVQSSGTIAANFDANSPIAGTDPTPTPTPTPIDNPDPSNPSPTDETSPTDSSASLYPSEISSVGGCSQSSKSNDPSILLVFLLALIMKPFALITQRIRAESRTLSEDLTNNLVS